MDEIKSEDLQIKSSNAQPQTECIFGNRRKANQSATSNFIDQIVKGR